jgi:hypothetical protein
MTKEQIRQLIPILQAWLDGKRIQQTCRSGNNWWLCDEENFPLDNNCDHRIKPEPREFYVKLNDAGNLVEYGLTSSELQNFTAAKTAEKVIKVREDL